MKNLIKLLVSGTVIWTSSAHAEFVWALTPFWRTLYQNEQVLKIEAQTPGLDKICADYQSSVESTPGKSDLDGRTVDILRVNTESITDSQFAAQFKVSAAASGVLIQKTIADAEGAMTANGGTDALPFFTLPVAAVNPVEVAESPLSVVSGANSLTHISQSLGLKPLAIQLSVQGPSSTIKVYGKDTVCDLYSGQASLALDTTGEVKISLDDQQKSADFYQGLETVTQKVFARGLSPLHRAVAMGYELGDVVYPLTQDHDKTASYIEALIENFFDDKMERNQVWSAFAGEFHLTVNGTAQGIFHITLEK
jgi:hypothetical protein